MQEWGRSSLALFDVREETKRLSDELAQFRLAAAGGGGGVSSVSGRPRGGSNKPAAQHDSVSMEKFLQGLEDKVGFL